MSLASLVLAALLLVDPSGDARGAGDLTPPTAAVYSSTAPFDLVEVEVLEASTLTLRVRLADRPNPGELVNGITLPVIDLYVDSDEGGQEELLPGPGLRMPAGRGWNVAIRVTGDAAFARRATDGSDVNHPVTVTPDGDALRIATPFAAPERTPRVHALTGVYDAFDADAWRPLTRSPSPWAFSSETARFPVVDLLAEDDAAQQAALRSGVLPLGRSPEPAAPWLVLMVLGLVIAVAGLLLRSRVGRSRVPADAPVATDADDAGTDGTRAYDIDTEHAAPLWGVDALEHVQGENAEDPDATDQDATDRVDTVGGSYDEAMLGPRAAEAWHGSTGADADREAWTRQGEEAAAVLSESDLFDAFATAPHDEAPEESPDEPRTVTTHDPQARGDDSFDDDSFDDDSAEDDYGDDDGRDSDDEDANGDDGGRDSDGNDKGVDAAEDDDEAGKDDVEDDGVVSDGLSRRATPPASRSDRDDR